MATAITASFGVVTLVLGLRYHDSRRFEMSVLLFSYTAAVLMLRRTARDSVERAAFLTALVTLGGTVALAILHPTLHSALVLTALFPAAVGPVMIFRSTRTAVVWPLATCVAIVFAAPDTAHAQASSLGSFSIGGVHVEITVGATTRPAPATREPPGDKPPPGTARGSERPNPCSSVTAAAARQPCEALPKAAAASEPY